MRDSPRGQVSSDRQTTVYKTRPGYIFIFPSDNECHIRSNHFSDSEVKVVDPDGKGWIKSFFNLLMSGSTVDELVNYFPNTSKETIINLLQALERKYVQRIRVPTDVSSEDDRMWWQHLMNQRRTLNEWYEQALADSSILVVGAGVLGSRVASSLAHYPLTKISIVDSHQVTLRDKRINPMYMNAMEGQSRADVLAHNVMGLNEQLQVNAQPVDRGNTIDFIASNSDMFDLIIWSKDDFLPHELNQMNICAQEKGLKWTILSIDGWHINVGPTFIPNQTGCYQCMHERLKGTLKEPNDLDVYIDYLRTQDVEVHQNTSSSVGPIFADIAAGLLVSDIPNIIKNMPSRIENEASLTLGQYLHLDMTTYDTELVQLLKSPTCQVCQQTLVREGI